MKLYAGRLSALERAELAALDPVRVSAPMSPIELRRRAAAIRETDERTFVTDSVDDDHEPGDIVARASLPPGRRLRPLSAIVVGGAAILAAAAGVVVAVASSGPSTPGDRTTQPGRPARSTVPTADGLVITRSGPASAVRRQTTTTSLDADTTLTPPKGNPRISVFSALASCRSRVSVCGDGQPTSTKLADVSSDTEVVGRLGYVFEWAGPHDVCASHGGPPLSASQSTRPKTPLSYRCTFILVVDATNGQTLVDEDYGIGRK